MTSPARLASRPPRCPACCTAPDLVRPETRQRVVDVIERLGFVPDGSAQGLSLRRKDIIGLVALERGADEIDIERSSLLFVDEIVHAVEAVLRGSEVSLLLSFGRRGESFQRRIRSLSGKVDGLLMAEDVLPASQLVALAKRVPLVLIARSADAAGLDAIDGGQRRGHPGGRHPPDQGARIPAAVLRRRPARLTRRQAAPRRVRRGGPGRRRVHRRASRSW